MSISGLVITLADDGPAAVRAERALAGDPRLRLGPRRGRRLAALADTPSPAEDRRLWERLHALEEIVRVDVVYVALDETDPPQGPPPVPHEESRP